MGQGIPTGLGKRNSENKMLNSHGLPQCRGGFTPPSPFNVAG
jgi:hypothetical protein